MKHKKSSPTGSSGQAPSTSVATAVQHQAQASKKKATLKEKTTKGRSAGSAKDGVLGGADYVTLMMGSRKKARQEAQKLSRGDA